MFDVFTNGEHKFVAICSRCLKRVPISTDWLIRCLWIKCPSDFVPKDILYHI
jgi:hypothetical protein